MLGLKDIGCFGAKSVATLAACCALVALAAPMGCFVKLPQTPQQKWPATLPDGKIIDAAPADHWVSPDQSTYPDWRWWVPDSHESGHDGDFHPAEISLSDGGDAGGLVFEWNCFSDKPETDGTYGELPPESFSGTVATSSFLQTQQVMGETNQITVFYVLCQNDDTFYVPERVYAVRVEEPTEASIQLNCDAPCYAFLTHSGCEYENFESCWPADDSSLVAQTKLLPGIYLVGVEFPDTETGPGDTTHVFDLHVALNRTAGQETCLTESATSASSMAAPQCGLGETLGWSTAQVSGLLEWSDNDDFYLKCGLADVAADKLGGMPDEAHRFEADLAGPDPGLVNLEVTFAESAAGEEHIIAVTGDSCGAADAVIDCAWGTGQKLSIEGISVFPGERLYAIVDGSGGDALKGTTQTPYELTWSLQSPCP